MTRADFVLLSGTANPALASATAEALGVRLAECSMERFLDGELSVRVEDPVEGVRVFIVQPTCPPVNENLMEVLALTDACWRAGAERVTAVVPPQTEGFFRIPVDNLTAVSLLCDKMRANILRETVVVAPDARSRRERFATRRSRWRPFPRSSPRRSGDPHTLRPDLLTTPNDAGVVPAPARAERV
jgi:phosphoribosylpyrophosphate synthetase